MNGDWCNYSAFYTSRDTMIYKEFYRYVYGIFEDAGVTNAIWIWNPNGGSFPDYTWNNARMYYPGDEYVDVVGLTCYNTGTYYPGEQWKGFSELYDSVYRDYSAQFNQPFMITEFSSASRGGDKAQWVSNMFKEIGKYSRIKIAVWWHSADYDGEVTARSYFIDETPEIVEAFKENLRKFENRYYYYDILI
jgi:beta-mannanase